MNFSMVSHMNVVYSNLPDRAQRPRTANYGAVLVATHPHFDINQKIPTKEAAVSDINGGTG